MASTVLFQSAAANRANGLVHTGPRTVPVGFVSATVTIQCTTGTPATPFAGFAHPFSSAAMSIEFGAEWSWDGGVTWPEASTGTQVGSPTGSWGTSRKTGLPIMAPEIDLGMPFNSALGGNPGTYRGGFRVAGGPITFGYTVTENAS